MLIIKIKKIYIDYASYDVISKIVKIRPKKKSIFPFCHNSREIHASDLTFVLIEDNLVLLLEKTC